jgi:hypothetical protein
VGAQKITFLKIIIQNLLFLIWGLVVIHSDGEYVTLLGFQIMGVGDSVSHLEAKNSNLEAKKFPFFFRTIQRDIPWKQKKFQVGSLCTFSLVAAVSQARPKFKPKRLNEKS